MAINHKDNIALIGFVGTTMLSGALLTLPSTLADDVVDTITITVPSSCSMSSTIDTGNEHTAEINNGQYNSAIGETTIKAFCNDNEGFAIYAIGYTDNELGKNVLTNATLGVTHDIVTGTAISGNTSNWAMKLSTITNPAPTYPIIIAGSTGDTLKQQTDPDFSDFTEVPDDYEKVAYRTSSTDINPEGSTTAEGSTLKTTYQAYISPTQAAGEYTGQVKYTMIHPYNATAPIIELPGVYTLSRADSGESATQIGQAIPNNTATYDSPAGAMDAWEEVWYTNRYPFYLKHTIVNDIITESYLGFTISPELATENEGMIPGDYVLRGGIDESSLQDKPIFTANVNLLKRVFDYANHPERCYDDGDPFICNLSNFASLGISSDGSMSVGDGMHCNLESSGYSSCEYQ